MTFIDKLIKIYAIVSLIFFCILLGMIFRKYEYRNYVFEGKITWEFDNSTKEFINSVQDKISKTVLYNYIEVSFPNIK